MARIKKGRWYVQERWIRCYGRLCTTCMADKKIKPHGPYIYLQRRNPLDPDGKQEVVYLGRVEVDVDRLERVNKVYGRRIIKPTKKQVMEVLV